MNQPYKAILSQHAIQPSLPIWGDLEGWTRMGRLDYNHNRCGVCIAKKYNNLNFIL
jgi:hypothetical protein